MWGLEFSVSNDTTKSECSMYFGPGNYSKVFSGNSSNSNLYKQNSDGSYNLYSMWFGVNNTDQSEYSDYYVPLGY